ncbi:MAG TPA: hypothetical protein VJ599_03465 [Nitrososphaeraceae archaeon]|nr:hypothetical protein [Nitrososphaeraceae archaeon]
MSATSEIIAISCNQYKKYYGSKNMGQDIRWQEVLNKRAIGIDKCDLGKVEQINDDMIITKKGLINKSRYLMPKKLVDRFDGNILYFKIMKAEARQFRQNELIQ